MKQVLTLIILGIMLSNCSNHTSSKQAYKKGTFGYDLSFLQQHDSVIVLKDGDAQVIVSAKYQAKVFTSTADGPDGASFGWIHYNAFEGPQDKHMNAYGGENRIWLGPEGGKYSLFFSKGAKMEFDNWKTPASFDTEPWTLKNKSDINVTLQKDMELVNYAGTHLHLSIQRSIDILSRTDIDVLLQLNADSAVKAVGYKTNNILTNTGTDAWNLKSGMPCIWMLDMFPPSPGSVIVIPYKRSAVNTKVATTDYFGEIPGDRIKIDNGILFFKADGKMRGKLGIHPLSATNRAGSYDPENRILTIILFDLDNTASYLNQEWNTTKAPFSGDAVNAYNDGPLADGKQMGPFYEMESVSPVALLSPKEALIHNHSVFHFTGDEKGLDKIAQKILGVSLEQIKQAFTKEEIKK